MMQHTIGFIQQSPGLCWSLTGELHLRDYNRSPMRNNQICNCYLMQVPDACARTHRHTTHTHLSKNPFKLHKHPGILSLAWLLYDQKVWLLSRVVSHHLSLDIYHVMISRGCILLEYDIRFWPDVGLLSTKDRFWIPALPVWNPGLYYAIEHILLPLGVSATFQIRLW